MWLVDKKKLTNEKYFFFTPLDTWKKTILNLENGALKKKKKNCHLQGVHWKMDPSLWKSRDPKINLKKVIYHLVWSSTTRWGGR